jgi:hypothetical protein
VTSARKLWSNRRNALRSTGPRTGAGKARAARNARRHGLNLSAACGPAWADEIVALARIIAGPEAGAERLELASRIAAAQIDVYARGARDATSSLRRCARPTASSISPPLCATSGARSRAATRLVGTSTPRGWPAFWRNEANGRKPRSYRTLEYPALAGKGMGTRPGSSYDLYGRVIGEHLFRHIPGNPTINMQHMPGAGGVIAGNHRYGPGPQGGTRILLSHSIPLAETLEPKGVRLPLPSSAILLSEAREGRH